MQLLLILKLIDTLAMGVEMAIDVRARYDAVSAKVRKMVEEDRDPTPEEWALIDQETNVLMEQILGEPT